DFGTKGAGAQWPTGSPNQEAKPLERNNSRNSHILGGLRPPRKLAHPLYFFGGGTVGGGGGGGQAFGGSLVARLPKPLPVLGSGSLTVLDIELPPVTSDVR